MTTGAPDHYKTMLLGGLHDDTPILAYITSDGRFVFRMEDWPDQWGEAPGAGIAELIAALTPAKRFDRRGQVIFIDNFDRGLINWLTGASGSGASIGLTDTYVRSGSYAVHMIAGSDGLRDAWLRRDWPLIADTRFGVEVSFTDHGGIQEFYIWLRVSKGAEYHYFRLAYDHYNRRVAYWDANGQYVTVASDVYLYVGTRVFNTLKLVIDLSDLTYVRWLLNNLSGSLTGIPGENVGGSAFPHIEVIVYLYSQAGFNAESYVDDIIITINEPA